jgi:hypothetical protein
MINLHLEVNGKSARVGLHGLPAARPKSKPVVRTSAGAVGSRRLITGARKNVPDVSYEALVNGDPEIDLALAGTVIDADSTPAFFDPTDPAPKPIGDFANVDIVFDASGAEKARRPHLVRRPNLNELHPVKVTKRMPLTEALMSFSFRQSLQLAHVDGLTFEFLRDLAKDLNDKQEVALLGAGPKANQPLVIREHGSAYRGFLFGETDAKGQYRLLLLLSDQELKLPEARTPTEKTDA